MKRRLRQPRSSLRLYDLALLGLLMVVSVAPSWAASRQKNSEPPAQPAVETPAEEEQNPPETPPAEAEERGDDQYRHSPNVQALARLLYLNVETAAWTFEIFNFSILALAIVIPLVRIMPRLIRNRSEKIRTDILAAQRVTQDANALLSAAEAKLANLDQEITRFRAEIEHQIAQDEQRGKAVLEEETARIVASAEAEISQAAAQAKRTLQHFAADLAIGEAVKHVKQLVLTPETDRALIAEFLVEAGRNGMQSEGKK